MDAYRHLTFMDRRCDLHFKLQVPAHMVSREPSAKVVAEHLIPAGGERALSSLLYGCQPSHYSHRHPQIPHIFLENFRLIRHTLEPTWTLIKPGIKGNLLKGKLSGEGNTETQERAIQRQQPCLVWAEGLLTSPSSPAKVGVDLLPFTVGEPGQLVSHADGMVGKARCATMGVEGSYPQPGARGTHNWVCPVFAQPCCQAWVASFLKDGIVPSVSRPCLFIEVKCKYLICLSASNSLSESNLFLH